jgi:hypothetical protein
MKSALVSGRKKNRRIHVKPHRMRSSYIDHLQELTGTENPDRSGPKAGPARVAHPQKVRPYGSFGNERISPAEAPPVARTGPPNSPWINRKTTNPAKFDTREVTAVITMKSVNEMKYGTFRPTAGISDKGLKNRGPTP